MSVSTCWKELGSRSWRFTCSTKLLFDPSHPDKQWKPCLRSCSAFACSACVCWGVGVELLLQCATRAIRPINMISETQPLAAACDGGCTPVASDLPEASLRQTPQRPFG